MLEITNLKVYGLTESLIASGYPMRVDLPSEYDETKAGYKDRDRADRLSSCKIGEGHDNWLNGIVVQFDLTAPVKVWTEAQRYHFLDFVSSQSTMHRLIKMDLDNQFDENVDPRMVKVMKELQRDYNVACTFENNEANKRSAYLKLLLSCPVGVLLTARMTTNYRQLKTIYQQRKSHRLPHWRYFCQQIEKRLPESHWITGKKK